MGGDTPGDSIHLSIFTLGSWQSYMFSEGKLACQLHLTKLKTGEGRRVGESSIRQTTYMHTAVTPAGARLAKARDCRT